LAFDVQDVDQALAQLKAQGVEAAMEPFDEGEGRLAFVTDSLILTAAILSVLS